MLAGTGDVKWLKWFKAIFWIRVLLAVYFLWGSASHKTVRLMRFRRLAAGHCHLPGKRLFARGTGLDPWAYPRSKKWIELNAANMCLHLHIRNQVHLNTIQRTNWQLFRKVRRQLQCRSLAKYLCFTVWWTDFQKHFMKSPKLLK